MTNADISMEWEKQPPSAAVVGQLVTGTTVEGEEFLGGLMGIPTRAPKLPDASPSSKERWILHVATSAGPQTLTVQGTIKVSVVKKAWLAYPPATATQYGW